MLLDSFEISDSYCLRIKIRGSWYMAPCNLVGGTDVSERPVK